MTDKTYRILILEDNASDAELMERELHKAGLQFVSQRVDTRDTFIKEFKTFVPDVILLDYKLPHFTGLEAIEIVKATSPHTPCIIVTGAIGEELAVETMRRGAMDYVLKDKLEKLAPSVQHAFREVEIAVEHEEIDKAKTEFILLASHQLRTPLMGIEWTIELFSQKEKLTDEGKKYLNNIQLSAKRLHVLIERLLDVSRIEGGSTSVSPGPLELVDFIDQYVRGYKIFSDKKNVSLIFVQHPKKLIAATDKRMVEYILQGLLANAIDYTPAKGKVEVLLEKRGDAALLIVRDTGIGIPKEEQGHIFGKFACASNASVMNPDGTGLGLYMILESVKILGGRIWFESEEGKGSTFFVEFPLVSQPHQDQKGVG
ncbi:MAG: hybrid sensor histidine kinase/response regulator [Candidatus Sungbacteria bacterium]|nr:hybrid sensor histidine kinase/response regulator [Candidatus Sungbacteria bacterium]